MTAQERPETPIEAAPFWENAREGRLVVPECRRCSLVIWYPRTVCPRCGSRDIQWIESSGRGTVYSYSAVYDRGQTTAHAILAYVDLSEGPRVLTMVVDADPADVAIGLAVKACFVHEDDADALCFRPADERVTAAGKTAAQT